MGPIAVHLVSGAVQNHTMRRILFWTICGIFMLLCLPLLLLLALSGSTNPNLSKEVTRYQATVYFYCEEYGIPEYSSVILAIMQQESGGMIPDVMQSSECGYNTKYLPREPNAITDPEYSIQVGVQYFADCLKLAGCIAPTDTEKLYLALQGYNFGTGYIVWALEQDDGYTPENAQEFSQIQADKLGWDSYGDPLYVDHVKRYLSLFGGLAGGGQLIYPLDHISVTSSFGPRSIGYHSGVDFAASIGTPVYAAADGEVVKAEYHWSWGNYVKLKHGVQVYTLYAHNSKLAVSEGDVVRQGQLIAYSGDTGNVTGPHVHFELYLGGSATTYRVDPMPYLTGEKVWQEQ